MTLPPRLSDAFLVLAGCWIAAAVALWLAIQRDGPIASHLESTVTDAVAQQVQQWEDRVERARSFQAQARDEDALAVVDRLLPELPPRGPHAAVGRVRHSASRLHVQLLARSGQTEQAIRSARALVAEAPRVAAHHALLGRSLLGAGRAVEAEAALVAALALDPADRDAVEAVVRLRLDTGRPSAALEAYRAYLHAFELCRDFDGTVGLQLWAGSRRLGRWSVLPAIDGRIHRYAIALSGGDGWQDQGPVDSLTLRFEHRMRAGELELRGLSAVPTGEPDEPRPSHGIDPATAHGEGLAPLGSGRFALRAPRVTLSIPVSPPLASESLDALVLELALHRAPLAEPLEQALRRAATELGR